MITPAEFEQAVSKWEKEDWQQQQEYEMQKVKMSAQPKGGATKSDGKKKSKKQMKVGRHMYLVKLGR
jgi:hypothetical protein